MMRVVSDPLSSSGPAGFALVPVLADAPVPGGGGGREAARAP